MTGTVGIYNYISNKLVPYFDYKKGPIEKLKKKKTKEWIRVSLYTKTQVTMDWNRKTIIFSLSTKLSNLGLGGIYNDLFIKVHLSLSIGD